MEYSIEQIRAIAKTNMQRLKNDEFEVAILPNDAEPYYKRKMARDSMAIKEFNVNSRLFQVTYED